jgi:hypothetical protein
MNPINTPRWTLVNMNPTNTPTVNTGEQHQSHQHSTVSTRIKRTWRFCLNQIIVIKDLFHKYYISYIFLRELFGFNLSQKKVVVLLTFWTPPIPHSEHWWTTWTPPTPHGEHWWTTWTLSTPHGEHWLTTW